MKIQFANKEFQPITVTIETRGEFDSIVETLQNAVNSGLSLITAEALLESLKKKAETFKP